MRIMRVGQSRARTVDRWDSIGVTIGALARYQDPEGASVVLARYEAGSVLGRHVARGWQLFAVVDGAGWVSGDDGVRADVGPGEAALWSPGESHESGSDGGMTVCIVESRVDPTTGLAPVPDAASANDAPPAKGR